MGLDREIFKRHRVYSFMGHEMRASGGMTLWDFCQAIMQFPADGRILSVREGTSYYGIDLIVASREWDVVEDGHSCSLLLL